MLHGQGFNLGGLLLAQGLALGLGSGLAPLVSLAAGLSLGWLAARSRAGGGRLASDRRCCHGRSLKKGRKKGKKRGEGSVIPPRARRCAGKSAGTSQCYKREPRDPGKESSGRGHQ